MDVSLMPIRGSGRLNFIEGEHDLPFPIKRVYYISGEPAGTKRGGHAHKALWQFLVCPYGRIELLLDDGKEKTSVMLDDPGKGYLLPPHYWHEMVWREDNSVLCVLASEAYDESDYIRNYEEFLICQRERNNAN